jgi:hypothetical protein
MARIIVIIVIVLFVFLFFGCVSTGDKYHTYRLEGVPLDRETESFFIFWWSRNNDGGQELSIPNINNTRESKFFNFSIYEKGDLEDKLLAGREINIEPYTLWMNFGTNNAQKIIINKLIFRSKSKELDLREIIGVSYMGKRNHSYIEFSEDEIIDFRKSSTIDINKLNNDRRIIESIQFGYDNIDVIFKKDKYFIIECDIIFENDVEGYETENYNFTAKFNRIKYNTEKVSLLTFLFLYLILKN